MPAPAHLTAFLAAAVVLAAIPGPGMLYVLARTLAHGRSAGLRSTLGTAAGGLGHVVAAAMGLSALLMTSALAFSAVKYAGAAYLIWLAVRTLLVLGCVSVALNSSAEVVVAALGGRIRTAVSPRWWRR